VLVGPSLSCTELAGVLRWPKEKVLREAWLQASLEEGQLLDVAPYRMRLEAPAPEAAGGLPLLLLLAAALPSMFRSLSAWVRQLQAPRCS
jgi:hypothetical protein